MQSNIPSQGASFRPKAIALLLIEAMMSAATVRVRVRLMMRCMLDLQLSGTA